MRKKLSHECQRDKKGHKKRIENFYRAQTRDKVVSQNSKETSNKPL